VVTTSVVKNGPMIELTRFLQAHGAATIPHPGGTLLTHLGRTAERLRAWGADDGLQTLALAHATYGTDGFGVHLLDLEHRAKLESIVGPDVEQQVYLYASCDRRSTYPRLHERPIVPFTDRFTGQEQALAAEDLRSFAELTAANELDVALHAPDRAPASDHRLFGLLEQVSDLLTPVAWSDCERLLQRPAQASRCTNRSHAEAHDPLGPSQTQIP
jgi:hypothetical protein